MNELDWRKPIMPVPPNMIITTPTNPSVIPINLFRFIPSCKKIAPRAKTNKGFVANSTDATPEDVYLIPMFWNMLNRTTPAAPSTMKYRNLSLKALFSFANPSLNARRRIRANVAATLLKRDKPSGVASPNTIFTAAKLLPHIRTVTISATRAFRSFILAGYLI